ncbi:MAG TPA: hypothetical protein VHK65_08495 [Candidatus Dormibacteraeota bacterium]|nr:hypothetical protein [Candidatus Dormibacteraeota bacterium]
MPAPVIRRDWVGLPPIQRIVGAHPLTAPSDRFRDDLVTHQDPSVSSDTMSHQVSAEAPPGLVLALARPTTRSDGPAMIPRPRVQRSVASAAAESGESDGDEAASESARPTPIPASAHTVAARELPVVALEPAVQRLVSLPPDAAPTPLPTVAQRSGAVSTPFTMSAPGDEPAETPSAPLQRLTLGQSRRMGLGAPINRVTDRSVQRAAPELPLPTIPESVRQPAEAPTRPPGPVDTSMGERAPMDHPVLQRAPVEMPIVEETPTDLPSAVRSRTSSLGAPLMPSPEASDAPRLDLPLVARRPAADEPKTGDRQERAPAPSVQLSAASLPEDVGDSSSAAPPAVQRVAAGSWPAPSSTESPQTLGLAYLPTPALQRLPSSRLPLVTESAARVTAVPAASAPDAATAPLVSARPLRPSNMLQPDASTDSSTAHPDATPQEAREFPLQRAMENSPDPEPVPRGTARHLPLSAQGPSEAPPMARLPLAPSRGFAVQRAPQPIEDAEVGSSELPSEGGAPVVQGAWFDSISSAASSLPSGAASAGGSAIGSAIGGAASALGGHKPEETDMDELAGKLYDRIRNRLKTELLVDRERAGFLTDLR